MKKLEDFTKDKWFFVTLLAAQGVLLPFASRNFSMQNIGAIVSTTLNNAPQVNLGDLNIYFQSLSLLIIVLLIVLRNKMRMIFNMYVAASYLFFAFFQNMAVTERFGFSVVIVNLVMFLFVAYVWIQEVLLPKNTYNFGNFHWKYIWMIILALFAYWFPFTMGQLDLAPLHFFTRNSATAFCFTTPLFLTILTFNLPQVNIVTYRITAIVGFIIGVYNMFSFFNPNTIYLGFAHLPLLIISLYCAILSYKLKKN